MSFADVYFSKQQGIPIHIPDPPSPALRYVIIIPAYQEENIIPSLDSLWHCARPAGAVEVIIVVNAPEGATKEIREANAATLHAIERWSKTHNDDRMGFYALDATAMPQQHAGVGLARKIGMDEAAWRFNTLSAPDGLIISFDADCLCDASYFLELDRHCKLYPRANGFNVYFEHPLSGHEFPECIYRGIVQYELHLRYYIQALRYAGYPYAFHTVGSCYAVKASAYVKQGGMNRRKSGEDFYFLHKIFPLGNFFEINTTRIMPSPRPSLRVPFGTGPTMHRFLQNEDPALQTYDPEIFEMLRDLFLLVPELFRQMPDETERALHNLHPVLVEFLKSLDYPTALAEINSNCSSQPAFVKRFYSWFNGLTVLKFMNYATAKGFIRTGIREAAIRLMQKKHRNTTGITNIHEILMIYREMERKEPWVSPLQQ
ncbi:MAG: glycosyltransferase family 2 protein [Bacteroidales bacterium]|nr:glycosyltransferase family 2 protein [Bacteroidales bacterium]